MFVEPEPAIDDGMGWQYWDAERYCSPPTPASAKKHILAVLPANPRCLFFRFDKAIEPLLGRHLVDRYILPAGHHLKTHRALQRAILQELDADLPKRQSVFDEVVSIVRKAFPVANIITRGDTSQYQRSARYIGQVMSVHTVFVQSAPPMEKRLLFAEVLSDAGYYSVNNAVQAEALSLLETAESTCTALMESKPDEVSPVLADILGPMQVMIQYLGVQGTHKALADGERTLGIRKKQKRDRFLVIRGPNWTL